MKYDSKNGILLCANLHIAFDNNYFYIDEIDCTIKMLVDEKLYESLNILNIEGKYIKELDNNESKKYLKMRNEQLKICK